MLRYLECAGLIVPKRSQAGYRLYDSWEIRLLRPGAEALRSRLGYLAATSVVAVIALAELAYLFERDDSDTFRSFGDALLWSGAVVLALQGDPVPVSVAGRAAMLLGFGFGLVIVATLAGTVGAFLVETSTRWSFWGSSASPPRGSPPPVRSRAG